MDKNMNFFLDIPSLLGTYEFSKKFPHLLGGTPNFNCQEVIQIKVGKIEIKTFESIRDFKKRNLIGFNPQLN